MYNIYLASRHDTKYSRMGAFAAMDSIIFNSSKENVCLKKSTLYTLMSQTLQCFTLGQYRQQSPSFPFLSLSSLFVQVRVLLLLADGGGDGAVIKGFRDEGDKNVLILLDGLKEACN
jgi:hypothetical protein